jgi:hypothetical protein
LIYPGTVTSWASTLQAAPAEDIGKYPAVIVGATTGCYTCQEVIIVVREATTAEAVDHQPQTETSPAARYLARLQARGLGQPAELGRRAAHFPVPSTIYAYSKRRPWSR